MVTVPPNRRREDGDLAAASRRSWARGVLALVAAQSAGQLAADRMAEVMARAPAILTSGSMNAAQ